MEYEKRLHRLSTVPRRLIRNPSILSGVSSRCAKQAAEHAQKCKVQFLEPPNEERPSKHRYLEPNPYPASMGSDTEDDETCGVEVNEEVMDRSRLVCSMQRRTLFKVARMAAKKAEIINEILDEVPRTRERIRWGQVRDDDNDDPYYFTMTYMLCRAEDLWI